MDHERTNEPGFSVPQISWRMLAVAAICLLLLVGCAREGVYHQVIKGQTLYRISKAYGINEAYLARINGISDPTRLRVDSRLFIPGATKTIKVPATVPAKKINLAGPVKKSLPATVAKKKYSRPTSKKENSSTWKAPPKSPSARKILKWPLRGKIVRSFDQRGKGGGKGLEIAAREGSNVHSAAAGKVIYSGDGVKGYGHLLIIQHENDLFTVYGFNRKNLVNQGKFVSQGEKIAYTGIPPGGGAPRLHFEVRKGKLPVDPILYLP